MANRDEEYVRIARQNAIQLWDAVQALKGLQAEWNAQDFGSTLVIDIDGNNSDVTVAQVGAVVFATTDAIDTLLLGGHATNLTALLE